MANRDSTTIYFGMISFLGRSGPALNMKKSPHGSGGFDFWVVPNQRSAVLDKLGHLRIRNHMKSEMKTPEHRNYPSVW